MTPERRFWFPVVGYNYRMTNIQAAIGLAQMERLEWFIERRREVAAWYDEALQGLPVQVACEASWAKNVYWLYSIIVDEGVDRDRLMLELNEEGIETRPFFYPMHEMPPYFQEDGDVKFPVTTSLAARGLNLPSSARITREDVEFIAGALGRCLKSGSSSRSQNA